MYPYEHWLSTPRVLFPNKDFTNLASAEFAVTQLIDPTRSIISRYSAQPAYVGKTLSAIAQLRGKPVAETLIYLIAEAERSDEGASIMGASMSDQDITNLLRWPHTNVCTDGTHGSHPRGHGAFTRVLGRYVREKKADAGEPKPIPTNKIPAKQGSNDSNEKNDDNNIISILCNQ